MAPRIFLPFALLCLAGCVGNAIDGTPILTDPVPDTVDPVDPGTGEPDPGEVDPDAGDGGDGGLGAYFALYAPVLPNARDPGSPATNLPDAADLETYGVVSSLLLPSRAMADAVTGGSTGKVNLGGTTVRLFPTRHLTESITEMTPPVLDAWSQGWTGLGQTIAIIDDFEAVTLPIYAKVVADRSFSYLDETALEPSVETLTVRDVVHNVTYDASHGEIVSMIAGGNLGADPIQGYFDIVVSQFDERSNVTGGVVADESTLNSAFSASAITVTYTPVPGIAGDALMVPNHVDLTSTQDAEGTIRAIYGHIDNSRDFAAINISISQNIDTVGLGYDALLAMVSGEEVRFKSDAVLTVAAGNTGAPCGTSDLNGCNALAVLLANLEQTRESTIVVGATAGQGLFATLDPPGQNETIASYSARAGALKDRFLLAPGDSGFLLRTASDAPENAAFVTRPTGNNAADPVMIAGTSFAAPRVAGAAAILRQKFPDLTGAEAASILLLTASKDINNDGFDDFSGISETFGHGKLDLASALSPFGTIAP